ncbi:DUF4333 domain-containing protein [Gordonia humi]|uniref:DUF4333 domain-containing protein n=1 Tax=Gordonia humi TaxID=686429 RepID=A0A840EX15_9ACTN|nr:DUF4333 domain-containing protein [Gordonia humi]MBB4134878.1 hypothetical protein [Gordonia humi]
MRLSRILSAGAALAALPLLAACGTTIDQDKLGKEITDKLNSEYSKFDRQVSSIACDDPGKDPAVGTTFECIADVDGAKVHIDVTTTSDDLDVTYETVDMLYDMAFAASKLEPSVSQQTGVAVTVDCGDGVKALKRGETFACTVSDGQGASRGLTFTVVDGDQDRWELD